MTVTLSSLRSLPSLRAQYRLPGTAPGMLLWSAVGLVGSVLATTLGRDAPISDSIASAWLVPVAWLILVVLALAGLAGGRGTLAATAVVASSFVLGEVVIAASTLAPIVRRHFDRAAPVDSLDSWSDDAVALAALILIIVAGVGVLRWVIRLVAAELRLSGSVERSPYRIEVLVLISVMVIASTLGMLGSMERLVSVVATAVPLAVVLALLLREPGPTSMGAAGGLVIASVALAMVGAVEADRQFRPGLLVAPTTESGTFVAAAVALLLVTLIVLWNLRVPGIDAAPALPQPGDSLDAWAGAALVLSFVPVLSIPAVVLGHLSYERLRRNGLLGRGRLVAAAAIVIGMSNVFVIVLVWTGLVAASAEILTALGS